MTNLLLSLPSRLGTGFPRPDGIHAGAATAIVAGDNWFLVDAGRGTNDAWAGTSPNTRICAPFSSRICTRSHLWLPDVFITSWQFGRKTTPLPLYGPSGIQQLSDAMLKFFEYDIHLRRDVIENIRRPAPQSRHTSCAKASYTTRAACVVTAFAVDHAPVKPAFGYRFDSGGQSIVVSGDTRPNANLIRFAKGADILVQEAYLPEYFEKVDNPEVAAKLKAYHTSVEEAGEIATAAGVKTLVLTHLIPGGAEKSFAERAAKKFHGKIVVGDD
jgi:ribonuclease Z